MRHLLTVTACALTLAACSEKPQTSAKEVSFAETVAINYQILNNRSTLPCDEKQTEGLCFQGRLTLNAQQPIQNKEWAIYFSNMSPVQNESSELFDIEHINGDLHRIKPTAKFSDFEINKAYHIDFVAGFWHLSETDMMPNYYLVVEGQEPELIKSTVPSRDKDSQLEVRHHATELTIEDHHFKRTLADSTQPATANWLFDKNQSSYEMVNVQNRITPTPLKQVINDGKLSLKEGITVVDNPFVSETAAAFSRMQQHGINVNGSGVKLRIIKDNKLSQQGYQLNVTDKGIDIHSATGTGAFYALQSLISASFGEELNVSYMSVEDKPRFEFRGMHLDVSRNFKSKEFVLQLLDQMAAYKLNKFHFHLADDEGWRIEIPDLPELTDVGAYRCHDLTEQSCLLPQLGSGPFRDSEVNGYYSVADYLDIVRYAQARHIQVIPSMDMPGHSRAAIKSMHSRFNRLMAEGKSQQAKEYLLHDIEDSTRYSSVQFYNDNTINACMDSSYHFIEKVVDEVALVHQQAGQPLTRYHIGADETAGAWIESAACKDLLATNVMGIKDPEGIAAYFIEKVSRLLEKRGIEAAGWNDGMGHTDVNRMPKKVQSNAWSPLMWGGHKTAHEQANRNWQVVVSSPDVMYFDFPYEADSKERGYYWAARRINTEKVFSFMPENLPAHAEYWRDREENVYSADDRKQYDENGKLTHQPLKQGMRFHGMQGQLWSETVRTDYQASYMIFPRLYALAERAWHQAQWELPYDYNGQVYSSTTNHISEKAHQQRQQDWLAFANTMAQKILPKADKEQLFYRLPTTGAKVKDGKLHMNVIFPGLTLQYQVNNGKWLEFTKPVTVSGEVKVRTLSSDGSRSGRILTVQ